MNVLIVGNGEIIDYIVMKKKLLDGYDYVISVDGGARHLEYLSMIPDVMIGDFDSIDDELLEIYIYIKKERFLKEKDLTDSELAFKELEKLKPKLVHVVGFLGDRWDHSLSNILLLEKYKHIDIHLIDEKNEVFYCDKFCKIEKKEGYYLSVLPLSDIDGLTIKGSKYELENKQIVFPTSRTISNEWIGKYITVEYTKGKLIIIVSRD